MSKEKIQIEPQYLIKLTATLLIICVVVAGLLGAVNSITAPIIEQAKWEKTMAAMAEVLQADEYNPIADAQLPDKVTAIYEAVSAGEVIGYTVEVSPNGFGGAIPMVVGVDKDGVVTGVSVVSHSETSNIGTKVVDDPAVLARFEGMSGTITVGAGEGQFDAVSGATVSSKGVAAGVDAAVAAAAGVQG